MFEFSSDQMYPYNLSRPMPMPMSVAAAVDRRWKPVVEIAPNCPRCDSSNTKFCYYNNYSLTQPRYFCKGCRRYWTKGGSLRNIPVGGGCRKNRRAKSVRSLSSNTSSAASRRTSASDSLRPADLALDDMVGGSTSNRSIDASSSTTNVPNIDLAILYSKFLSHEQQPPRSDDDDHQGLAIPADDHQSFHDLVGSSSGSGQAGLMGDEFSYGFDPSGTSYEPLVLDPTALDQAGDVFSTNCHQLFQNFPWQAPEQLLQAAGCCPVLDIDISSHHHHQDLIDNDWCTSIDQSSFGAF